MVRVAAETETNIGGCPGRDPDHRPSAAGRSWTAPVIAASSSSRHQPLRRERPGLRSLGKPDDGQVAAADASCRVVWESRSAKRADRAFAFWQSSGLGGDENKKVILWSGPARERVVPGREGPAGLLSLSERAKWGDAVADHHAT